MRTTSSGDESSPERSAPKRTSRVPSEADADSAFEEVQVPYPRRMASSSSYYVGTPTAGAANRTSTAETADARVSYTSTMAPGTYTFSDEFRILQERRNKIIQSMNKPPLFDGRRPASWINHMEVYLMSAEVPEDRKLPVAVTYLDPKRLDWFTVAIPDNKKPRDWEGLKRLLKCHFGATSERDAREQLLRVKQTTTVQDYLWRFNEAVTDCPTLKEDEKMELFIDNLKAEIAEAVGAKSPHDLEDAIREAVRAEGWMSRRDSVRSEPHRAGTCDYAFVQAGADGRATARQPCTGAADWSPACRICAAAHAARAVERSARLRSFLQVTGEMALCLASGDSSSTRPQA